MASQLLFCQFCGLIIDQNEIKNHGNNICNKNAFNICQFNISDEFSSTIKKSLSMKDEKKKNEFPVEKLTELDKLLLDCNQYSETKFIVFNKNREISSNENNTQNNGGKLNKPIIQYNNSLKSISLNNSINNSNKNVETSTLAPAPPIMLIEQNQKNKIIDDKLFNDLTEIQIHNVNTLNTDKKKCKLCNVNFKNEEKAILLPCSHFFHIEHLRNWFKTHNNCPTCSMKISSSTIITPGK